MFVTGILNDWRRKLEEGRRRLNNERHDEEEFLANQKCIWTPPELFEKCCPRWLAGGNLCSFDDHQRLRSRNPNDRSSNDDLSFDDNSPWNCSFVRLKDGNWTCPGGCDKIHPTITLFFEGDVQKVDTDHRKTKRDYRTIAILSSRLDPFITYFDSCVADGSAICKTPYYYELDGFLRENVQKLRQQQHFGSHLVKVAMGAMKESDRVHRELLEEEYRTKRLQRTTQTFDRLEEVLGICKLHRLSEDLDVMSIYCMQRTSRSFRRIANLMAQERMRKCQLVVSPLVDGHFVAGYSAFRRANPDRPTILQRENGRLVEYAVGPQIVLKQDETELGIFSPGDGIGNAKTYGLDASSTNDSFSWACEELSFANLEREWGDIGIQEYVGQKVLVQWRRSEVDMAEAKEFSSADLTIYDLRITFRTMERRSFAIGYSSSLFSFNVLVEKMEALQIDDVTVSFSGSAKILSCKMDFRFLVAEYARSLEPCLTASHRLLERTRPLLQRELAFLEEVKGAVLLGSRT